MTDVKKELLDLTAEAYGNRLLPRLEGLTDEEYLWEPVPDCWTVHPNGDGTFRGDWGFIFDEIPPFTTIAWRMCHLIDCYGSQRAAIWLDIEPKPNPLSAGMPGTAEAAIRMLRQAHDIFVGYISSVTNEHLWTNCGPVAGIYAEHTRLSFLLHELDEVIHHGAEVAVLRDLYRAQRRNDDPFVLACLKADRSEVESIKNRDSDIVDRMIAAHPNLMLRAAETGRWEAIPLLADLGFPVNGTSGRGPLHHTASVGNLETTKLLINLGADLNAKDPVYDATPLGWAEFFKQDEMVDYLRALTPSTE